MSIMGNRCSMETNIKDTSTFSYCAYFLRIVAGMIKKLILRYFVLVCDYMGKADLSEGIQRCHTLLCIVKRF